MHWHIVIEATAKSHTEAVLASLPNNCTITLIADRGAILRTGRTIGGHPVRFVDSVVNAMASVNREPKQLLLHIPEWSSINDSVFQEAEDTENLGVLLLGVVDRSGKRQQTSDWNLIGMAVFGPGNTATYAKTAFVTTGSSLIEIERRYTVPVLGPKQGDVFFINGGVSKNKTDIMCPGDFLDIAIISAQDVAEVPWRHPSQFKLGTQEENELAVREAKSHWVAVHFDSGPWTWETVTKVACGRSDRDALVFPGLILINPGSVRRMPPIQDPRRWMDQVIEAGFRVSKFDASGASISEYGIRELPKKTEHKLKVAVTSMCGVTSFEDRYGLGGEHQVVHWLKEGFDAHPDVDHCDIFDTLNSDLAQDGYYDLVLSNSCWRPPPKVRPGGTSIFWHFNTNAFRGTEQTIIDMGYTNVWTNSPSSLLALRKMGVNCAFKHLNASTIHHEPYRWESSLFRHDACYVGGYQTEYKGKGLIDAYIKSLCGKEFDFAIYGNRKWRASVQREALKTDKNFKQEHYDESFEAHYKHVLHPDDFPILSKNCKVWVNFNAEDQRPLGMVNDRPIWAMACGAFFITDDTPEQRALYGDTCDYSTGGDDLVDKVRYWIPRDKQRLEMAAAATENIMKRKLHTHATVEAAVRQHRFKEDPDETAHELIVS